MAKHNELGKQGEDIAVKYLTDKGYEILERNWRNIHKEIDIIAIKDNLLAVVEVKTRQTDEYGEPDIAVTRQKQTRLISAANAYLFQNKLDINTRFDIISIVFNNGTPEITHIEDAFLPHWWVIVIYNKVQVFPAWTLDWKNFSLTISVMWETWKINEKSACQFGKR